jgi:hypothetical protein
MVPVKGLISIIMTYVEAFLQSATNNIKGGLDFQTTVLPENIPPYWYMPDIKSSVWPVTTLRVRRHGFT